MNQDNSLQLKNPPIVEAVLDIECDLPISVNLASLAEPARSVFGATYPKFQKRLAQGFTVEMPAGEGARMSIASPDLQALQFIQDTGQQLVQIRTQGYSFNRLTPYGSFDDYLSEIERTWRLFVDLVQPVKVRAVQLRYINRLLLPFSEGRVDLDEYLTQSPKLPVEEGFGFTGFVQQYAGLETATGHQVHIVTAAEESLENTRPILLDIQTSHVADIEPSDWDSILSLVLSLRRLKNLMFSRSLTEKCLSLYR